MKRSAACLLVLLMTAALASADTIVLKDGRRIDGEVLRFENDQFVVQVANPRMRTGYQLLYFRPREIDRIIIAGRSERGESPQDQPEERTAQVEVTLADNWVDSGLDLRKGQRVSVRATGTIYLEGQTPSGPNGTSRRDPKAPAPNSPEGMLIGAIGEDPAAEIFTLGADGELQADRDGRLYLTVNKQDYQRARGSYQVRLTVERERAAGANQPPDRGPDQPPDRGPDQEPPRDGRVANEKSVVVQATDTWFDTGLRVQRGQRLNFTATGEIRVSRDRRAGPDGAIAGGLSTIFNRYPLPEAPTGALIGKIVLPDGSESQPFLIGRSKDYTVSQGGRLWVGINDDDLSDNEGRFTLRVRY